MKHPLLRILVLLALTLGGACPLILAQQQSDGDFLVNTTGTNPGETGNLTVQGDSLLYGEFSLGLTNSGSNFAVTLGYAESGSSFVMTLQALQPGTAFLWQDNGGGVAQTKMSLSGANVLTLYGVSGTAAIVFDPNAAQVTINGQELLTSAEAASSYLPLTGGTTSGNLTVGNNLQVNSGTFKLGTSGMSISKIGDYTMQFDTTGSPIYFRMEDDHVEMYDDAEGAEYRVKLYSNSLAFSSVEGGIVVRPDNDNYNSRTIFLPDTGGKLALQSELGSYLLKTGGTVTGNLNVTGTANIGTISLAPYAYIAGQERLIILDASDDFTRLEISSSYMKFVNSSEGEFSTAIGADRVTWISPEGHVTLAPPSFYASGTHSVFLPATSGTLALQSELGSYLPLTGGTVGNLNVSGTLTLPDNIRQTFRPGASSAGLNVGALAGTPSAPQNGDIWYNSTANTFGVGVSGTADSLLTSSAADSTYLPLTGGTLSGNIAFSNAEEGLQFPNGGALYEYDGELFGGMLRIASGNFIELSPGDGYAVWINNGQSLLVSAVPSFGGPFVDINPVRIYTQGEEGDSAWLAPGGLSVHTAAAIPSAGNTVNVSSNAITFWENIQNIALRAPDDITGIGYTQYLQNASGTLALVEDLEGYLPLSGGTISNLNVSGTLTLPDNIRQTFNPGAVNAGLNVGSQASAPNTPQNGDIWYDSTANKFGVGVSGTSDSLLTSGAAASTYLPVSGGTMGGTLKMAGGSYFDDPVTSLGNWTNVNGSVASLVSGTLSAGSYIQLGNGVIRAELPQTASGNWKLSFKALHSTFSRTLWVGVFNAAGTQGYGMLWNSSGSTQFGGQGYVNIQKFALAGEPVYADTGTSMATNVSSGHAVAAGLLAEIELSRDAATNTLTLKVDGVVKRQVTDASYGSFDRIYMRGNSLAYFDDIRMVSPAMEVDGALALEGPVLFPDNIRQTFNPGTINAGLNVGAQAGDPAEPQNGDLWYDATSNTYDVRVSGTTASLLTSAGAAASYLPLSGGTIGNLNVTGTATAPTIGVGGGGNTITAPGGGFQFNISGTGGSVVLPRNIAGTHILRMYNSSTTSAASARMFVGNNSTDAQSLLLGAMGSNFTTAGPFVQNGAIIATGTGMTGGLNIGTLGTGTLGIVIGGTTRIAFGESSAFPSHHPFVSIRSVVDNHNLRLATTGSVSDITLVHGTSPSSRVMVTSDNPSGYGKLQVGGNYVWWEASGPTTVIENNQLMLFEPYPDIGPEASTRQTTLNTNYLSFYLQFQDFPYSAKYTLRPPTNIYPGGPEIATDATVYFPTLTGTTSGTLALQSELGNYLLRTGGTISGSLNVNNLSVSGTSSVSAIGVGSGGNTITAPGGGFQFNISGTGGSVVLPRNIVGTHILRMYNSSTTSTASARMFVGNTSGDQGSLELGVMGAGFTTAPPRYQNGATVLSGTSLSGGLSVGTQAAAPLRLVTGGATRWTLSGTNETLSASIPVAPWGSSDISLTTGGLETSWGDGEGQYSGGSFKTGNVEVYTNYSSGGSEVNSVGLNTSYGVSRVRATYYQSYTMDAMYETAMQSNGEVGTYWNYESSEGPSPRTGRQVLKFPVLGAGVVNEDTGNKTIVVPRLSGTLAVMGSGTNTGSLSVSGTISAGGAAQAANAIWLSSGTISAEGSSADGNEAMLTFADPTADRTITFPNASGTVALVETLGSFISGTFTSNLTLSGTNANIVLGSNYISGNGEDKGISVSASGNVGAGIGIVTSGTGQVVVGKYNDTRTNDGGTNHTEGVFIVGSGTGGTGSNALRILADGTVLVKKSGDIDMGEFTNGPQP